MELSDQAEASPTLSPKRGAVTGAWASARSRPAGRREHRPAKNRILLRERAESRHSDRQQNAIRSKPEPLRTISAGRSRRSKDPLRAANSSEQTQPHPSVALHCAWGHHWTPDSRTRQETQLTRGWNQVLPALCRPWERVQHLCTSEPSSGCKLASTCLRIVGSDATLALGGVAPSQQTPMREKLSPKTSATEL